MEYKDFIGETVILELSGNIEVLGVLLDIGNDIVVIYNSKDYLYIPRNHIQHMTIEKNREKIINVNVDELEYNQETSISLRKTLLNAKGIFSEILLMKNKPIFGYVVSVMNDYLLFYSPIYKHMYISLNHIKWLIPYEFNQTPYGLDRQKVPFNLSNVPLTRAFVDQVEKFTGEVAVFDLGDKNHKIGLIKKVDENTIELISARSDVFFLNVRHINSFYL